jgi:hypothetical protein
MKSLMILILISITATVYSQPESRNPDQRIKNLASDVDTLVQNHIDEISKEDKRYVRKQLRDLKFLFKDYGFNIPGRTQTITQKYFTARCKVRGYSNNNLHGPVASIEELTQLCKISISERYRNQIYLKDIQSETYTITAGTYFYANCKVNGYSNNNFHGPFKTIEELHTACKSTIGEQYKKITYLKNIKVEEFPNGPGTYYQANCKINGYSNNGIVGPSKTVEELFTLCQQSIGDQYRKISYLANIKTLEL